MERDLKDYRKNELNNFVFGNILVIIFFSGLLDKCLYFYAELSGWTLFKTLFSSAIFSSIFYMFVFISDSLLSQNFKNKLIWFIKGRPGDSIFTNIRAKNKDFRFTSELALNSYEEIYNEIDQEDDIKNKRVIENSSWYKIYKKYERHPQIYNSQRDFLLCRDMTFMTLFITICYIGMQIYRGEIISIKMILFFIVEFLISWCAARNKSKAFAYNVIALDLSERASEVDSFN